MHVLKLASEAQSGLKIPPGQIAGGQFTIAAGQTKDLDIDVNSCPSIVANPGGQFILKPVLHAGEVGLSSAINGAVIDSITEILAEQRSRYVQRRCSTRSTCRQHAGLRSG
jgi:hypothetical protein